MSTPGPRNDWTDAIPSPLLVLKVDGQRIHRVIGRESENVTRTQAEEFISKGRAEANEGRLDLPKGRKTHLTFAEAAAKYLKNLRSIGGKDFVKNEQHLRGHLVPYLGGMPLNRISTFTIEKFRNHCTEAGLSIATTNRTLATFRRMGNRLHEWGVTPAPFAKVKLESEHNQRDFVLSHDQERQLLDAALQDSNPFVHLFVRVGLATGLRHSEILAARFEHLDSVRRRLRVRVKGGRLRNQPLTKGITAALVEERRMANDPYGWVFPSRRAKSGHIETMSSSFSRCVRRAGFDPRFVIPHTMRHTAITRLAETGADIKTLQEFSGHESISMALRYAHPQGRAVDSALDRMEQQGTPDEHARAKIGVKT
ncbi:MAG: site-specific integrase [Alphaproteobacteria bacterium]|nr:site-specific integrase [Alphaproteobacteria bacterium]